MILKKNTKNFICLRTSGDFDSDIEIAQKGSKYVAGKGSDRFNIDTTSGDLRIKKA